MSDVEHIIEVLKSNASSMENATDWFREHLENIYDIDDIISKVEATELIKRVINNYLERVNEIVHEIESVRKTLVNEG
jgi:predicted RNA-binding protein with EMAP domain